MTNLSKILLTVAVAGLAGGGIIDYHGVKDSLALAAVLPLGAIATGLFMIALMLEKEMAKYDEEQAQKLGPHQSNPAPATTSQTRTVQLKEKTA